LRRAGETVIEDIVVVGGGPAGAATAIGLARGGRKVTLVERTLHAHHAVCGEFISGEALAELDALGLDVAELGAVAIDSVALNWRAIRAEVPLPFPARSLSRLRLDEALLTLAERAGVRMVRGVRIGTVIPDGGRWRVHGDGWRCEARQVVLAIGKHDLRGLRRPPGGHDDLVGFKLHWRLRPDQTAALSGRVELSLFPGGYAGLELVERGVANLSLVVQRARIGDGWDDLLARVRGGAESLDERLGQAEPLWDRPLATAALPYGYLSRVRDGIWRVGDQAAVIPSFAGDGLAIALFSARMAAERIVLGGEAEDYQAALSARLTPQVRKALWLSRLMVRPSLQPLLAWGARRSPGLITRIARATRIPAGALGWTALRPTP
jgi:flavin-dependent dehydrogenase